MRFCTAAATTTSLAPFERLMPSATTGSPLKRAKVRRSAMVSVTVPRSSSRTSPPRRQADHGSGKFVEGLGAGQRADRLIVLADFGPPAGEIDIGAAQAVADIDGGKASRLQAVGIERDQISRSTPPMRSTWATFAHALQRAFDDVVDEVGQLLRRLAGRNRRIGDDRQADDIDALINGSLTFCGRLARTRVTASLTSFKARSVLVSSANWIVVTDSPSVIEDEDVPHALDAGYARPRWSWSPAIQVRRERRRTARPRPR